MAKLARAVITVLAIVAGPAVVGLVKGPLLPVQYNSDLHLRGSLDEVSEFQLRGSVR
jgi:hypothetical protein